MSPSLVTTSNTMMWIGCLIFIHMNMKQKSLYWSFWCECQIVQHIIFKFLKEQIAVHIFYLLSRGINIVNWITMTRKSAEHLRMIYENTGQLFRPNSVSSAVYTIISIIYGRSNQWPQIAVLNLYNWATSSYRTQVTPNQLVMVIVQPNNLNVSGKLHLYSFQRTWSSPRAMYFPRSLEICKSPWCRC